MEVVHLTKMILITKECENVKMCFKES